MPPFGFKRSRALWDEARRSHDSAIVSLRAWSSAILYELQPVRFSEADYQRQVILFLRSVVGFIWYAIISLPGACKSLFFFLKNRTRQQWMVVAVVIAYYYLVRFIHELLDAGPLVLIFTALTALFTFGLGDNDVNPGSKGLSAYSVFNRGFERIMGSVDVDSLLAQHVGGGLGGAGIMMNNNRNFRDEDDAPPRVARRPARNDDNDSDDEDGDDDPQPPNENNNNRARKSGKKARRRNLEQRQEIRRQREAAMALGHQGGGEGQEEMMAMQRLIEEQIAEENANDGNH